MLANFVYYVNQSQRVSLCGSDMECPMVMPIFVTDLAMQSKCLLKGFNQI